MAKAKDTVSPKTKAMKASIPSPVAAKMSGNTGMALLSSGQKPVTKFQHQVLAALCTVPAGKVTTYKILAHHIQCRSNQAVGQALRRNPYAPTVPCHRVVSQSGAMGGFGGMTSGSKIDAKIALLRNEGVLINENGVVDPGCIYKFE
mmetsp:Transcript_23043/g.48053  ORF Transcript_23043/g.48053 Transcript_23043/m.48053 type:complete len:147 (-) Transcript_23043:243-683(-)